MHASFLLSLRTAVVAVGLVMGMAAGAAPGPADAVVVTASLRADLAYTPSGPSLGAGVSKASDLAGRACVSGDCGAAAAEVEASAGTGAERQTYALLGACLLAVIFMSRRRRRD